MVTKGGGSKQAALAMAYKLLDTAQDRWRRFNGHELIAGVLDDAVFKDGERITEEDIDNNDIDAPLPLPVRCDTRLARPPAGDVCLAMSSPRLDIARHGGEEGGNGVFSAPLLDSGEDRRHDGPRPRHVTPGAQRRRPRPRRRASARC